MKSGGEFEYPVEPFGIEWVRTVGVEVKLGPKIFAGHVLKQQLGKLNENVAVYVGPELEQGFWISCLNNLEKKFGRVCRLHFLLTRIKKKKNMYTPYEVLDRTLSSPAHFLAMYLVLANTFLITTHHSFDANDKHEYAKLYAWWIIYACTQVYTNCTGTPLLAEQTLEEEESSDPDTDSEEVRVS